MDGWMDITVFKDKLKATSRDNTNKRAVESKHVYSQLSGAFSVRVLIEILLL